jgi:hypothetical protein
VGDRQHKEWEEERKDPKTSSRKKATPLMPDWFDSDLHVTGRPFFITAETPEEVSDLIDRYCAADSEEAVDALVLEQMRRLNPELPKHIKPKHKRLPSDEEIARRLLANLDESRKLFELAKRGESFVNEDGIERDAKYDFAYTFPLTAVAFAAVLRPGWRSGGRVWPTYLLNESGLWAEDYFEKPLPLFRPLLGTNPMLEKALKPSIVLNYELGGYVRPNRVRALRKFLREEADLIVAELEYGTGDLRKIDEALYDATRRKLGFIEAAEIFGGIMDITD